MRKILVLISFFCIFFSSVQAQQNLKGYKVQALRVLQTDGILILGGDSVNSTTKMSTTDTMLVTVEYLDSVGVAMDSLLYYVAFQGEYIPVQVGDTVFTLYFNNTMIGVGTAEDPIGVNPDTVAMKSDLDTLGFIRTEVDGSITNELQNLTYSVYPDKGIMNISNGTGDTIPVVDETNAGLMLPADKNKLDSLNNADEPIMVISSSENTTTSIEYGALYNYYAATDVREITPTGWRIPVQADFNTLIAYLTFGASGNKLREVGTEHWTSPNTGATNEVGWNGRGGGDRNSSTNFAQLNNNAFYWVTDMSGSSYVQYSLAYNLAYMSTGYGASVRYMGVSLRPIKESTTLSHGETGVYVGNDGKTYTTICIGTQEWLAADLAETKYRNGDWITGYDGGVYTPISNVVWNAKTTEAMCFYDDNEANAYTEVVGTNSILAGDTLYFNNTVTGIGTVDNKLGVNTDTIPTIPVMASAIHDSISNIVFPDDSLYFVLFNGDVIPVLKGDTVITLLFDKTTVGTGIPGDSIGVDTTKILTIYRADSVYVPYEDAYKDVDLGTNSIKAETFTADTTYVPNSLEVKGETYWDEANRTMSTVLGNGVIGQWFKESYEDGQNNTGVEIVDGTPVSYAGSIGNSGNFRIKKALASKDESAFYFIGLATEHIPNDSVGKITTYGKLRGIQTNGANYGETWVDGDTLYVSATTAGYLTNTMPEAPNSAILVGLVISAHATNGTIEIRPTFPQKLADLSDVNGAPLDENGLIPVWNNDSSYFDFTKNINEMPQYHGIFSRNESTISYSSSTRTITVTPTGASWRYYFTGTPYDTTAISKTHADITGLWFLYYDSNRSLVFTQTVWDLFTDVPIAAVVYYDVNSGFVLDERHSYARNLLSHYEFHHTIGTYLIEPFGLYDYLLQPTTPTTIGNRFKITSGVIADEDIIHEIPAFDTQTDYPVYLRSGSGNTWTIAKDTNPFITTTGAYAFYNPFIGGTWTLTEMANNEYMNVWVAKTGAIDDSWSTILIQDQDVHDNLTEALDQTIYSMNLDGLPVAELEVIYKVTFRANAAYSSEGKVRIAAVTQEIGNLLSIEGIQAQNNHNSLSGLQGGQPSYYGHLDTLGRNRIDNWSDSVRTQLSLTTIGNSGASTYLNTTGVFNVPNYTLTGLGGQPQLNGTGFVKASGTTISYDTNVVTNNGTATDNALARFDGATGKLIQNSPYTSLTDAGDLTIGNFLYSGGLYRVIPSLTNGDMFFTSNGTGNIQFSAAPTTTNETGAFRVFVGGGGSANLELTRSSIYFRNLIGTGNRLVLADNNGKVTATITDYSTLWNNTADSIPELRSDISTNLDTARAHNQRLLDLENNSNPSTFLLDTGIVTDRNIDVTIANYIPTDKQYLKIVTDNSIVEGDTITMSINGGTQYQIVGYTSHADSLALSLVWLNEYWGLYSREGEDHLVTGENTGNQTIQIDSTTTEYIVWITNGDTVRFQKNGITLTTTGTSGSASFENNVLNIPDYSLSMSEWNLSTQTLTGTTVALNVVNGQNATLTLSGVTTITLSNLEDGMEGTILVTNDNDTSHRITFAGYTNWIYPSVAYSANIVNVSGGTNGDVFTWGYKGGILVINGVLGVVK